MAQWPEVVADGDPESLKRLLDLGENRVARPLGFVYRPHDQDGAVDEMARDEAEQLYRGSVGSMKVVEHDQ